MRNIIICFIMALILPFGVWVAGCRRETQSARMPGSPETARILRAPGSSIGDIPAVSPAEIDPAVAGTNAAHSRVQAAADREAVISSRHDDAGLFVLPPWDGSIQGQNQQPVQPPARIWSRPVSGETLPELTPLQFHPAQFDVGIDHLMAMAPSTYPNLDPSLPHGDPTLIPGMYFGPNDLALGGTKREIKANTVETSPSQLPPAPRSVVQSDAVALENIRPAPVPIEDPRPHDGVNESQPIAHPAASEPAKPARPAVIKLKPIGREEIAHLRPPAASVKAAGERAVVDKALEADLLELPTTPQSPTPSQSNAPEPVDASSFDPLSLDITAIMGSSAWEKENETALPPEPVAASQPPAPAASAPSASESATPAAAGGPDVGTDNPDNGSMMDMQFSEIAPPPLPKVDEFMAAPMEEAIETLDQAPSPSTPDAKRRTKNESEKIDSSWLDGVGTAGGAQKSKAVIQPLLNIDFSMYDWEMKTAPHKSLSKEEP